MVHAILINILVYKLFVCLRVEQKGLLSNTLAFLLTIMPFSISFHS